MTPEPPRDPKLVKGGAAGLAAALALAVPLVANFEGERRVGYLDIIKVPTYCFGGTGPEAVVGRRYTAETCRTQLAEDAYVHAVPLTRCIKVPIPPETFAAMISLSYNIGPAGVCRSSAVRYLNLGDIKRACSAITLYDKAGGRVIRGLQNRRAAEKRLCLRGVS